MSTVIDFSASIPSPTEVKKNGHSGAVFYISPARESWMRAKPVQKNTIKEYADNGLKTAFVWQYGSSLKPDILRGYNGGVEDARKAQKQLNKINMGGHPVFFAVDFDITLDTWNSTGVQYFKGACSVLGVNRVGIYGHSRVISWAKEDGVVATVNNTKVLGWQTKSWSYGEKAPEAVLYQGTHNVSMGPHQVDINEVWDNSWGWLPLKNNKTGVIRKTAPIKKNPNHKGDPTFLPMVLKAFGVKVEELGDWRNIGHGDFGSIQGIVVHHTGTVKDIPGFIQNHPDLGLCSQIHLNRNGTATIVGAGIAYHAGKGEYPGWLKNNANYNSIGIEAASDGVTPWSNQQLDAYYRTCAAILWYLDKNATTQTLIAHHEYSGKIQGKWDPGAGNGIVGSTMDMNNFRKQVQKYIDNPPFKQEVVKEGELTVSEADRVIKYLTDYINGYLSPVIKDVKDCRGQLTGSRNIIYKDKERNVVDMEKSYPGWEQLGQLPNGQNMTLVNAVAALRHQVADLQEEIKDLKDNKKK